MALRACNNPQIIGPVLSHKITKLVTVRVKAVVALGRRQPALLDGRGGGNAAVSFNFFQ